MEDGPRVPGGCDDCNAYQTLVVQGRVTHITVHHDDHCPFFSGRIG